jgi:hypothetical protein
LLLSSDCWEVLEMSRFLRDLAAAAPDCVDDERLCPDGAEVAGEVGEAGRPLLDGFADESSLARCLGGSSLDRGWSSLCFRFLGSADSDCRWRSVSDEGVIEASADWARDAAAFLVEMERALLCCSFFACADPFCFFSTPLMLERRLTGLP